MIRRLLIGWLLRLLGWRPAGEVPAVDKCLMLMAPHTSNWDFPLLLLYKWYFRVPASWMGKHTLFAGPFAWFFRATGGLPVDRDRPGGAVQSIADEFASAEHLVLALAPEGTRSWRPHWKSGFYRIALATRVPVALVFLDWRSRTAGFGPTIHLSGDVTADMDRIRAFYEPMQGRNPENFGPVRLATEDDDAKP